MDDLERELRDLAASLETPDPPDVTARVRARLAAPPSRRRRWRHLVAAALAALVVAALPPGRAALADAAAGLLRFAGITVATTPDPARPTGVASPLPTQRPATVAEAQRKVRFPVRTPTKLGPPEQVLVADPDGAGFCRVATLLYRGERCASTPSTAVSTWPSTSRAARRVPRSRSTATSPSGSAPRTRSPTWIAPAPFGWRPRGSPPPP